MTRATEWELGGSLGTYFRETVGGGSWTRTGNDAGSGINGYTLALDGDERAGHFNASHVGSDRYNLLEHFNDISNTGPGVTTPGNVSFHSHGLPFRDPTWTVKEVMEIIKEKNPEVYQWMRENGHYLGDDSHSWFHGIGVDPVQDSNALKWYAKSSYNSKQFADYIIGVATDRLSFVWTSATPVKDFEEWKVKKFGTKHGVIKADEYNRPRSSDELRSITSGPMPLGGYNISPEEEKLLQQEDEKILGLTAAAFPILRVPRVISSIIGYIRGESPKKDSGDGFVGIAGNPPSPVTIGGNPPPPSTSMAPTANPPPPTPGPIQIVPGPAAPSAPPPPQLMAPPQMPSGNFVVPPVAPHVTINPGAGVVPPANPVARELANQLTRPDARYTEIASIVQAVLRRLVDEFMQKNIARINVKLGDKLGAKPRPGIDDKAGRLPFPQNAQGAAQARQAVRETLENGSSVTKPFMTSGGYRAVDIYSNKTGMTVRIREDGTFDTLIPGRSIQFGK